MSHVAKKAKTTPATGPLLYSDLDLDKLTVAVVLEGKNETRFATVEYNKTRLVFQGTAVTEPMRAPFGVDDGSKFNSKPSIKLELKDAQLAFVRNVEEKVIMTAIKHSDEWFSAVKPPPTASDIRNAFSSRVAVDAEYPATLRVNVNLSDEKKKLIVMTTKLMPNGKIEPPKPGSADDVKFNDCVVPVLKTAGGVWIKKTKKLSDNCFGIIFEAAELLVVKGAEDAGVGSFNLGGVEVASDAEETEANEGPDQFD